MSSTRFLGGLLIGGALGAIIGLMMAPRKGEETRQLIREELSNRVDYSLEEAKSRTAILKDRARDKADQLRERGQSIASDLERVGRETMERLGAPNKQGLGQPLETE